MIWPMAPAKRVCFENALKKICLCLCKDSLYRVYFVWFKTDSMTSVAFGEKESEPPST